MQLMDALGDLKVGNLAAEDIQLDSITDINGIIKLPDGNYRICFYARYFNDGELGKNASDPNIGCSNNFTIASCSQPINGVLINTIVKPPNNPNILQTISIGGVSSILQFTNPPGCNAQVKLFGKIERITPSPFSMELDPEYQQQTPITVTSGAIQLSPNQMIDALNNFNESNLVTTGVDLATIKDANNNSK